MSDSDSLGRVKWPNITDSQLTRTWLFYWFESSTSDYESVRVWVEDSNLLEIFDDLVTKSMILGF